LEISGWENQAHIYLFHVGLFSSRYYSIFNFDLESNLLLEIDEDTGKLKGNWPYAEINMRLAVDKGQGALFSSLPFIPKTKVKC